MFRNPIQRLTSLFTRNARTGAFLTRRIMERQRAREKDYDQPAPAPDLPFVPPRRRKVKPRRYPISKKERLKRRRIYRLSKGWRP